jgi:hypothetical protein
MLGQVFARSSTESVRDFALRTASLPAERAPIAPAPCCRRN